MKEHVLIKHSSNFGELCKPIIRGTPINYIGLARIYTDNSRSYLITDPAWGEVLLENNYHLAGTEDGLLMSKHDNYQLWNMSSMFSLNDETRRLYSDCINNNYGNGVTLMERGENFVEFIHICANSNHESVNPYLEHNIDQLWNRVVYLRDLIYKNRELKNAYSSRYYYDISHSNLEDSQNKSIPELSKPLRYDLGGAFDGIKITRKEFACLMLLYQNIGAKEQAYILKLSYRSVEAIIERIKRKCGAKNKNDLLLKLSKNHAFQSLTKLYLDGKSPDGVVV